MCVFLSTMKYRPSNNTQLWTAVADLFFQMFGCWQVCGVLYLKDEYVVWATEDNPICTNVFVFYALLFK
jgi:hypothetical protein